jgi:hypothetical protein
MPRFVPHSHGFVKVTIAIPSAESGLFNGLRAMRYENATRKAFDCRDARKPAIQERPPHGPAHSTDSRRVQEIRTLTLAHGVRPVGVLRTGDDRSARAFF